MATAEGPYHPAKAHRTRRRAEDVRRPAGVLQSDAATDSTALFDNGNGRPTKAASTAAARTRARPEFHDRHEGLGVPSCRIQSQWIHLSSISRDPMMPGALRHHSSLGSAPSTRDSSSCTAWKRSRVQSPPAMANNGSEVGAVRESAALIGRELWSQPTVKPRDQVGSLVGARPLKVTPALSIFHRDLPGRQVSHLLVLPNRCRKRHNHNQLTGDNASIVIPIPGKCPSQTGDPHHARRMAAFLRSATGPQMRRVSGPQYERIH